MLFAHLADCHIGAWRDEKLKNLNTEAFLKATQLSMDKKVDFILISGDLFNTSLPSIDNLKTVVGRLKELKDSTIPVYIISGSHDFSPSGKTILDVLEKADLLKNVFKGKVEDDKLKLKFIIDEKTGAKIIGVIGKKGMLERTYYEQLDKSNLENEDGYKIFMFHTALTEFKPKNLEQMESAPLEFLPKNFNYYAGGHVHYIFNKEEKGYGLIVYPGALSPTNFKEMEEGNNGFYLVSDGKLEFENIQVYNIFSMNIDCEAKTPQEVEEEIKKEVEDKEFINTIVTMRLHGCLKQGKPSDINFKELFNALYDKSAYFVMRSTSALTTKEFKEMEISTEPSQNIEAELIKEHVGQIPLLGLNKEKEARLTKRLMEILNQEKQEGETIAVFEERIERDIDAIFKELKLA